MSSRTPRRPHYQRNLTSDASTFTKLKHYFHKGSKISQPETTVVQTKQRSEKQANPSHQYWTRHEPYDYNNGSARPDLVPPRGPRQLPRAVYGETTIGRGEVESESTFSNLSSGPSTSLTSMQSSQPPAGENSAPSKKRAVAGLPISDPQPTQSLLDLASRYADVQNPEKAYNPSRRAEPTAMGKPPVHNEGDRKVLCHKLSRPVMDIAKGQAHIVAGPVHQRSQKTVVRKMEPQQVRRADGNRHRSNVTLFEDFMGHEPQPPVPSLPKSATGLGPGSNFSQAHRLSRPFGEVSIPDDDDSENISPTSLVILPRDSHAQTWLRYDRSLAATPSQSTNAPLFPPRDIPSPNPTPINPSSALPKTACKKPTRKPVPTPLPLSSPASTAANSANLSPRPRRKDIPPEYAHIYSPPPSTHTPSTYTPSNLTHTPSPPPPPRNSYYTTPLPDGTYPRYRTPPPPPVTLRKPAPPSSIYPATPFLPFHRLSRPPDLPPMPQAFVAAMVAGGGGDGVWKPRQARSSTVGTFESYRAERENEVIDAYREGEGGEVSPLSACGEGWDGKGWGSPVSEVGREYEGVGWRMRR
ncbi:MAG: hypothetical protein Q9219_007578 [cf. Caloplaca sp. 3 TL-2023]